MGTKIFPNSLSNDGVDKLNHKWMLLLMLLLAFVSFIIPLHPSYNNNNNNSNSKDQRTSTSSSLSQASALTLKSVEIPTFRAVCWTPAQFTWAMEKYATAHCTNAYNAAVRGKESKYVYRMQSDMHDMPSFGDDHDKIQPRTSGSSQGASSNKDDDSKHYIGKDDRYSDLNKFKERVQKLVSFQAPLTLLLVAVCLGLSQMVWAFLSECVGSFNVGRTLEGVSCESKSMDTFERLVHSVTQSGNIASCLYLVKKLLSILFVFALLLVLALYSLPQVEGLHKDFDAFSATLAQTFKSQSKSNDSESQATGTDHNNDNAPKHNDPFFCDMQTRRIQDVQSYSMQCIPVQENEMSTSKDNSSPSSNVQTAASPSAAVKNFLEFESLIFKIAFALLIILLVSNIFSFLVWAYKLVSNSSRASLGLRDNAAMDLVFLVQMARVNTSAHVTHQLARSSYGAKL